MPEGAEGAGCGLCAPKPLCKRGIPPIPPWMRGGRRGKGLGDTRAACCPHAKPTGPGICGRSGARAPLPGSGIFKQLLPALGRWHQEPGIRECGKRLAGGPGWRGWSIPALGAERPTEKGWLDGWTKGWMNRMDRSQQLLIAATPARSHEILPERLHPCHELGGAQPAITSKPFPTTAPLEPPDNPNRSCQVPAAPSPAPAGRMRPAASKANLPALLLSCCKTLRL